MKKQPEEILSHYTFGKLPPQATELEEAVLGACLVEQPAVASMVDLMRPECFYFPQNQLIFEAIVELFRKNKPVDILTVSEQLKNKGKLEEVGGMHYISNLTNKIASTANIEEHAHIVIQKYISRTLIQINSTGIKDAYEDTTDIFELLDDLSVRLMELRQKTIKNKPVHIEQVANDNLKEIKEKAKSGKNHSGILSGIKSIDEILGGFLPQLYILAARPRRWEKQFCNVMRK
jgi:replicative DNA helicase